MTTPAGSGRTRLSQRLRSLPLIDDIDLVLTVRALGRTPPDDDLPVSMARFAEQRRRVARLQPAPLAFEKRIFFYWRQGLDSAPPLVRASHASWRAANPDFEVVVLDDSTLGAWIDTPSGFERLPVAMLSDVIRLRLMERHGGVWADATTIATQPLSDWLGRHMQSGLFAFSSPGRDRLLASWFLASEAGGLLATRWRTRFEQFLRAAPGRMRPYFSMHYAFEYAYRREKTVRDLWRAKAPLSALGPIFLRALINRPDDVETPTAEDLAAVPMHKLSWKNASEAPERVAAVLGEFGIRIPGMETG